MKKYIYIISSLFFLLTSCGKEGVGIYDSSMRYLYIPDDDESNIITFSFKHHSADIQSYDLFFDIKLAGLALEQDASYNLEVVKEETTADNADYSLETQQIFHAGKYEDQLKVTVHKTDHLDRETAKLTLRLLPNETFKLGDYLGGIPNKKSIIAVVNFDNKLSRPEWWNEDIVNNYLGEWSEFKYEKFVESCNGEIYDLSTMTADEKYMLALQFKDDIKENNWIDPVTGKLLEIPVLG